MHPTFISSPLPLSSTLHPSPSLCPPRRTLIPRTSSIRRITCAVEASPSPAETEWQGAEKLSKTSQWSTVMSIDNIMTVLPHRFPFLLIDKVIAYEPGKRAVAIKNVSMNEPHFPGHFPNRPIMPGVLQVEALAQVGGIVMLQPPISDGKGDFFFGGVDKVKWRKPVLPGDTLVLEMELESYKPRFGIAKMIGKGFVDGALVVEGLFTLVMVVEK